MLERDPIKLNNLIGESSSFDKNAAFHRLEARDVGSSRINRPIRQLLLAQGGLTGRGAVLPSQAPGDDPGGGMGDERESELVGLQSELAGVALRAAMSKDPPSGPEAVAAAGSARARRTVRMSPLAWMAVAFVAGTVAGSLLQPVRWVRRGRDAG